MASFASQIIPDESAAQPRWQDHWPSVAYTIDYDYQNNRELDPEMATSLLKDMGATLDDISHLTMVVSNKYGALNGRYLRHNYNRGKDRVDDSDNGIMTLPYLETAETRVQAVLHEGTHFLDDLNDNMESRAKHMTYIGSGGLAGVALAGCISMINGATEVLSADYPLGYKVVVGACLVTQVGLFEHLGIHFAYRALPSEKRAFAATRNQDLVNKYMHTLFA